VGGTPATAPTLSSTMADMAEDAKEDFVTAEEIEQGEGSESEATVEAEAETASESEAKTEPQAETETKGKHAAVEANPASLEKAPLEIAIDDEPKKEDAKVSIEAKMPTACAAPAATQTKKPQPAPTPKKKGFFARLFGR
jgi:polyphosphate kinase